MKPGPWHERWTCCCGWSTTERPPGGGIKIIGQSEKLGHFDLDIVTHEFKRCPDCGEIMDSEAWELCRARWETEDEHQEADARGREGDQAGD